MLSVINALIPVIMIILLGVGLKRIALFSPQGWRAFEDLCYFVLYPALLIRTLATAQIGSAEILLFSGMVLFAILAMSALMLMLYPLLVGRLAISPGAFTSLFQGATRWHGFIALSMAGLMYGEAGVTYMAITMAVIIPPLNIVNVWVLAHFTEGESSLKDVLIKLLQNPFILACVLGAFLNLTGIGLPAQLFDFIDIMSGGALSLGLLTVGAGLKFGQVLENRYLVGFGTLVRLLGMPMLMFLGAWLFGIDGVPRTIGVLAGAVPTAAASYILARQMGGDAPLMANLITVQVVASAFTLPLMIWLTGS